MAMCYNFIRQKEASIYNMHPLSVVQIGCDNKILQNVLRVRATESKENADA